MIPANKLGSSVAESDGVRKNQKRTDVYKRQLLVISIFVYVKALKRRIQDA